MDNHASQDGLGKGVADLCALAVTDPRAALAEIKTYDQFKLEVTLMTMALVLGHLRAGASDETIEAMRAAVNDAVGNWLVAALGG